MTLIVVKNVLILVQNVISINACYVMIKLIEMSLLFVIAQIVIIIIYIFIIYNFIIINV